MAFHEVRFPSRLSFGSAGGPERRTDVVTLANGFEERNTAWAHSRRRYDAGLGVRSLDDLAEVLAFFEARAGRLYGFRWKDWVDFKSCAPSAAPAASDQALGTGDGARATFQLAKTYMSGSASYLRPVRKPVDGTVAVAVAGVTLSEGVDFEIDAATGQVTLAAPPGQGETVTAGFEFDVPVRFDTDVVEIGLAAFEAGEIPSIPIVEVRV